MIVMPKSVPTYSTGHDMMPTPPQIGTGTSISAIAQDTGDLGLDAVPEGGVAGDTGTPDPF